MSDKKHIDRLYQEKFKEFEPAPPSDMWDRIEKELPEKKKRRVVPLWYYGGIAAGLAVLLSLFLFQSDENSVIQKDQFVQESQSTEVESNSQHNTQSDAIVNGTTAGEKDELVKTATGNTAEPSESNTDGIYVDEIIGSSKPRNDVARSGNTTQEPNSKTKRFKRSEVTPLVSNNPSQDYAVSDNTKTNTSTTNEINNNTEDRSVAQKMGIAARSKGAEKQSSNYQTPKIEQQAKDQTAVAAMDQQEQDSLANELVKNAVASEENKADSLNMAQLSSKRFTGSTLIAPVYSNSLSGSSINTAVADNATQAGYNLSYGISLGYDLSDRWTIRTGIHKTDVSYTTGDVRYASGVPSINGPFAAAFDAAAVTDQNSLPTVTSSIPFAPDLVSNAFLGLDGELSQQLGYIEVPLEMRYKLVNSRLNISVAGGFSALFLQENQVQIVGDNRRLDLGSDNNFRDFNQSANFGLGLDYGLTDRLGIMLEPMFKYQFNALSNDPTGFRPYTIAVYSGLTYKF